MRKPLACALAGFALCIVGAAPPRASADAAVTSAVGQVPTLTSQAGVLLFNPVPHTKVDNQTGPTSANVTTYDESVSSHQDDPGGPSVLSSTGGNINQPNVVIGRMTSDASVDQRTTVTSDGATVDVESSAIAEVGKTSVVGNCCFGTIGSATTSFDLRVELAKPCRYRLGGSMSTATDDPSGAFVSVDVDLQGDDGGPFGGHVVSANSSGHSSEPLSLTGVFQPGTVTLHVSLHCDLGSIDTSGRLSNFRGSQARASWVFAFSLTPSDFPNDIRWTKRSGGDFGTAANWDPQQVPVNGAPDADNAIFDLPGTYTVGFGAAQASGRLEVLQGGVTLANANYAVDGLTLVAPSLVVDTGKLTLGSGHLTSNSATIGDMHDSGAEVRVDGSTSRWDCLGRLLVGGADGSARPGTLTISNGGTMTTGETRIGAGGAQRGVVSVSGDGSTWNTNDVQIGSSSPALLTIDDGADVTSAVATVGGGLGTGGFAGEASEVHVASVSSGGTSSHWGADRLVLGRGAFVSVADGARIDASDIGVFGGGTLLVETGDQAHGRASLVGCNSLSVGSDGTVIVQTGGDLEVTVGNLLVGVSRQGAGNVVVDGTDPQSGRAASLHVDGQLQVPGNPGVGDFQVRNGGAVTSGPGFVGTGENEDGTVLLDGAGSSWAVTGNLRVGGIDADAPDSDGRITLNGGLVSTTGDFIVEDTGVVVGNGNLVVLGTLIENGFLGSNIVQSVPLEPLSPSKRRAALRAKTTPPAAAVLTIQGNLVVGPTGVVRAEAAGALSDRIVVTGSATLDGTLVLQFKNGFAPKANAQFEVFHVNGAVTGAFATVETRGLAPGAQFDVTSAGGAFTVKALNDTVALPTVSVKASAKKLLEKQAKKKKATLTFSRKGPTTAPLVVSYTLGGSATNGFDYVSLPGVVTIPAKKKSVKVTVQLVDDPFAEPTETIDVAVVPGTDYTESLASTARIAIVDNPPSR